MMSINLYYNQVLILQGPAPETRRRQSRAPRAPRHRRGDCSIQRCADTDLGPAVRRTGRRLLRTKSRVLSNSSLSDISARPRDPTWWLQRRSIIVGQCDLWTPPRDPSATKKGYLAALLNECAPPCTRCSSSEGRLQNPHSVTGFSQAPQSTKYARTRSVSRSRAFS